MVTRAIIGPGIGMSSNLVHKDLLSVIEELQDFKSFSIEQENIKSILDKYKCLPQNVMLWNSNGLGTLAVEDHWRVLTSKISIVPEETFLPATTRWKGVVIASGCLWGVGIEGRSSSHFISDES